MPNITTIIIIVFTLAYVLFHLSNINKSVKENAYQWWYMPWFALVFVGLMYLIYNKTNFPDWPLVRNVFEEYKVEAIFSLLCAVIWTALEYFLLRSKTIHNKLIVLFRRAFAKDRVDRDKVLPFPYYIDEDDVVRAKVGQVFYRWTMKAFILTISVVYVVFFVLNAYFEVQFYLTSALGMLALLPLVDYYVYLCAQVPPEEVIDTTPKKKYSDFDELWRLYVGTFDDYSVAWKKTLSNEELKRIKDWRDDNEDEMDDLMNKFMKEHSNGMIENYDLVTAFMKLLPFFDYVEKNGKYVLIALDIPKHFTVGEEKSYIEQIATKLSEILKKSFFVYEGKSTKETLNNSIVVAPLSLLSRRGADEEWMKKIGLITVVNMFDKGVSNMYECRRFSFVLKSVNDDYQIIFVTPHRRNVEPSAKNTWLTSIQVVEKPMIQFPNSERQFFIGYDFENYRYRFNKILKATTTEPVYSGSEMATIALSSKVGALEKVTTPVHEVELAYTNAIEGKEELGKFCTWFTKDYQIAKKNINENFTPHLFPVEQIIEEQIFNVIYDQDNNAPAVYAKWVHLGTDENFSIVISKPYLFRDYFNANHDFFVQTPFAALQPHLCKSRITLAIVLLNMLQKSEMEECELRELLLYYYKEDEIMSVPSLIKNLFTTYFSSDLASMMMTKDQVDFDGENYTHHIMYSLKLTDDVHLSYLDIVTVKDESGNELFELLYDLMYQNYDTDQIHSFSGKPYKIREYNKRTKTLNVSSVNNNDKNILFYKPGQIVTVSGHRTPIKEINSSDMKPRIWRHPLSGKELSIGFEGFETNLTVENVDWYEFHSYDIKGYHKYASNASRRNYTNGKVLKMSLRFWQKPEYLERIDDIRKGLQVLFYEAFQSVFPHHAQYLIMSSIGDGDPDLPWIFNSFNSEDQNEEGVLSYYFIEDAHIDLGLIGSLANSENIWYILKYIYDYLIWLTEGNTVGIEGFEAYLTWLDQSTGTAANGDKPKNPDKFCFLKMGREQLPSYLDVDLLINFIRDFFEDSTDLQQSVQGRQSKHDTMGVCDFCRKEMKNSEMQCLKDGRMRCPDCSVDAIDTYDQFLKLCDEAKGLFMTHLGIDFGSIPFKENLVSAVELHKLHGSEFSITNGYDVRKLVGFAWNSEGGAIYVEDGRKSGDTLGIIIHEMTHIWEFSDDEFKKIRATNEDWLEGLAVWTDLYLSEKAGVATMEERKDGWLARTDEYGRGLKLILDLCPDDPYGYIRQKAEELH